MAIDTNVLSLLYSAIEAAQHEDQFGIVVETSSIPQARTKISITKKEHGDPSLDVIECRPSPIDPNQLWLIVKGKTLPETSLIEDIISEMDENNA